MISRLTLLFALFLLGVVLPGCEEDAASPTPSDGKEVTVAAVVDGDTIELADGRRLRYLGINTPEQGQPFYEEATEANRRLVEGKRAWMVLDTQPTDRYGRILAYVWVGGKFINLELVRQGYANVYTEPPNVRYSSELVAAEQEAREAESGLWKPADTPVKIQDIHYDAPGPDQENPNGEWVELSNAGRETVELAGFTLKDEANHIYSFPAVGLKPGQVIRLYSGKGRDSNNSLYWGLTGDAVWSNSGDTAYLRDREGRIVDTYTY